MINYLLRKSHHLPFLFLMVYLVSCDESKWVSDPASYVNPFIGTAGERSITDAANTVPGAVMPFGMLSFGPENSFSEDMKEHRRYKMVKESNLRLPISPGGYNYAASRVKGFSLTRLSGTGCIGASGDIPILPFTKSMLHSPDVDTMDAYYSAGYSHENEKAKPGYYQVGLDNGVNVELTATERSGMARFSYPEDQPATLLFRTSYSQLGSGNASTQIDVETNEVSGSVTSGNFCGYLGDYNQRDYYTLYFVAQLDADIVEYGGWENENMLPSSQVTHGGMTYGEKGIPALGMGSGAWVTVDAQQGIVNMRVGISYVSVENARLNLMREQANDDNIDSISRKAYQAWNESLAQIEVECEDKEQLTTFYTALYHSQFHPNVFSDVNGEYAGFDGQKQQIKPMQTAQYANFSGWDVYRSQLQLLTLTHPRRASDIAQSLLNQADQNNGVWDRWTHNNGPTGVMSGDPAAIAISNFVAFGADKFEVEQAYQSLATAAKVPTDLDLSDEGCPIFCRGQKPSLDQWQTLKYISDSSNTWEGASETLEQASSFFALSQLAGRLGQREDSELFLEQSGYWANLFNPNATADEGYIQGRNLDGSWKEGFDPSSTHLLVEGSSRQYTWMVPFDGKGLFEKMGGPEIAARRLDRFFHKPDGTWALYREGGAYSDVSNQPSINAPWMYLFAGKAYKTQETVRATMQHLWNSSTTGIPGQDDLGQMSSWYVFSALGMYPLYPGRADLVLGSPSFSKARIKRSTGDILITANSNNPSLLSSDIYVQSLKVDGKESSQAWISEDQLLREVNLEFEMGDEPNKKWASGEEDLPPSYTK
ncbi:MAG: GH92 family glycosyl hydrolase [Reichenbachiella sp.]|uniref:GH92 family glycosyl hydrolase n=1 Tax=Reichenbachiella sp. TaxID=2184521 RepID=UPI003297D816